MRMGNRRMTRLTNAFSKKAENHAHMMAIYFMHYNFRSYPSNLASHASDGSRGHSQALGNVRSREGARGLGNVTGRIMIKLYHYRLYAVFGISP